MNINTTIADIQAEFDRLKNIIEEQKLELAQLKSEGLSKIDAAWRTPSPDRDPNKELLNSMIQARANELQVSEGIMWGLVVDMVKRDGMNLEVDVLPEPVIEDYDAEDFEAVDKRISETIGLCKNAPKLKVGDYFHSLRHGHEWRVIEFDDHYKCICTKSGGAYVIGQLEIWNFYKKNSKEISCLWTLGRHPENQPNSLADLDPFTCELEEGDVCEVIEVQSFDKTFYNITTGQQVQVDYVDSDGDVPIKGAGCLLYRKQLKLISRP